MVAAWRESRSGLPGDGLSVIPTAEGTRLRCVFQRLEGEATREGLWLTSTVTHSVNDRFRVTAVEVGRALRCAPQTANPEHSPFNARLENTGTVEVVNKVVRFLRPGLTEEYSVSMDGLRQDFVVLERPQVAPSSRPSPPVGEKVADLSAAALGEAEGRLRGQLPARGKLRVELEVNGARVEPIADGARLVLENSGRKIAYSRLRVTDAMGKELPARMEVMGSARGPRAGLGVAPKPQSAVRSGAISVANGVEGSFRRDAENDTPAACAPQLAVLVNDTDAVYPIRIDPTFSDANWSALGSGMNGPVYALAISVSDVYAGGGFTTAGGVSATNIAKWDGRSWSALGSGLNGQVYALAVSGSNVYAGGNLRIPGALEWSPILKWNGSAWIGLGIYGSDAIIFALAVVGNDLYVGGSFWFSPTNPATIAKWNGSSWSALGSGMDNTVLALAVSGSDLYAGGGFTNAGGMAANYVAKWNGSSWSALGSGMGASPSYPRDVLALAVSGSDLYAGGLFTTAGGPRPVG